jgi:cell division protein FtsL
MLLINRRRLLFHLINILFNLFTHIHSVPISDLSIAQPKDSIYNQLINGQDLIVHEERGVVFSRVGHYYEVDDIFGLTVTVPVTQYVCSILPMEQVEKLSLCVDYEEVLRVKIEQEEVDSQSSLSDFLNSTNNTRFSAEKVPIRTHHRHHHRTKRFIPLIVGVVAGALGLLFMGGITVFNTIKGAQLSSRVSEIQRSVSDTNKQLHNLEVSVLTNTNSTIQLARSFSNAQENMETMRTNMETIVKHVSRLDSFAEAQTRYNLKTHAEHVYERMKSSMRRIERNDLNLDFVGMTEQNEILEIIYERLKHSIPSARESKATFISRMLFAQTVQFLPSENGSHTNDTTGYYPEYLGNIVFTSYFSVLKTNAYNKIQVYKLTALPFFIVEKEIGKELSGLPKIIGISNDGYIEWREIAEQQVCDFGNYTVCRDPPIVKTRINNMCLEQLISTNRSFHCHVQNSLYSSPHFEKIASDIMALSTRTPINCAITGGFHIFKNLSIIHLGCNDTFYCEGNVNFIGDKRCQMMKPYIVKTINDDIVPVVESIRPLNISLPKVYPFASDKNLILTLEEQMRSQEKNMKETEKTSDRISKEEVISVTRPVVIFLSVTLSVVLIVLILLVLYLIYRCRHNSPTGQSPIVTISTATNQPTTSILPTSQDDGSLHDLLQAFAINKLAKI